ncbi:MAG: amidohydrolase family protein [Deltaproteobacteria bacterium]|nr:amidohydrolase family protein [Deltaproteobacteria bacterium]
MKKFLKNSPAMPFLDAHTHAYPEADLQLVVERVAALDGHLPHDHPTKWQLVHDGSIDTLVLEEGRAGMDGFVLLPISGRMDGASRLNRWVADLAARHPRIIPFGTLTPLSDSPEADLKEALSLGIRGIKIHSVLQRIIPIEPRTLEWLEMIQPSGLPLLMDSMHLAGLRQTKPHMKPLLDLWAPFETGPVQIAFLARTFPRITFIAAHLGCLYGWDQLEPLLRLDNVFFDLSFALEILPPAEIRTIINQKGTDHILFGSDCPWRDPAGSWQKFLELGLPGEEMEKIGGGNLIDLLGEQLQNLE